jgi:hypothetical protein
MVAMEIEALADARASSTLRHLLYAAEVDAVLAPCEGRRSRRRFLVQSAPPVWRRSSIYRRVRSF